MKYFFEKNGWAVFLGILTGIVVVFYLLTSGTLGNFATADELIVSEVCARNNSILTSEGICDYFELYNPTDKTINLSGIGFSDNTVSSRGVIPQGTTLKSGETKLFVLRSSGRDFGLKDGETFALFDVDNELIFSLAMENTDKNTVWVYRSGTYVKTLRPSPGYPNTEEGIAAYEETTRATSPIAINELCSENYTLTDGGDWAELINTDSVTRKTDGLWLSDDRNNLFKIKVPGVRLKSGELLVVDLGDGANGKTFSLKEGEFLYLSTDEGKIVQSIEVLYAEADETQDSASVLEYPTPGFSNDTEGYTEFSKTRDRDLVISEVMASNTQYLPGPYAATHDYIEIYNATGESADLSLYYISKAGDGDRYPIGEGYLEPGKCVVIFAEKNATRVRKGYTVVDFGISSSGCSLVLWKEDKAVDVMRVPSLSQDQAWGIDANYICGLLAEPSPEQANF